MHEGISNDLTFDAAAQAWLVLMTFSGHRGSYVAKRTLWDFAQYIRALNKFFAKVVIATIHLGHIRNYQVQRSATAGPNKINQELGLLVRVLKAANLWTQELEQHYRPLQHIEPDIPRALSPAEQKHWLGVTGSIDRLQLVYWYSILALRTTARTCEIRKLKLGDLNLETGILYVRSASKKTRGSLRTIPLTEDAVWACERILERAKSLGSSGPQHYLFPFREKRDTFDPARPMTESGLKKPWDEARTATGIAWFRQYDWRHTAITRLAEVGTPIQVIMSYTGQLTIKMVQHYTAISEQSKRKWVDLALEVERRKPPVRVMWKTGTGVSVSSCFSK